MYLFENRHKSDIDEDEPLNLKIDRLPDSSSDKVFSMTEIWIMFSVIAAIELAIFVPVIIEKWQDGGIAGIILLVLILLITFGEIIATYYR